MDDHQIDASMMLRRVFRAASSLVDSRDDVRASRTRRQVGLQTGLEHNNASSMSTQM